MLSRLAPVAARTSDKLINSLKRTGVAAANSTGGRTWFSTSSVLKEEEDDAVDPEQAKKDCAHPPKLPCLKSTGKKHVAQGRKVCDKMCIPCCKPARDPPDCAIPFSKPPCFKVKPPRPAYSECLKEEVARMKPCECAIKRPPPCEKLTGTSGGFGCGE